MKHRLLATLLVFLLLVVPLLASAQEPPPQPPSPQRPETEPNDDFYQAELIMTDVLYQARIGRAGDEDYFVFPTYGTTTIFIDVRLPQASPLTPVFSLYDAWENLLVERECPREGRCLTYDVGDGPAPTLVVSDRYGRGGLAYEYSFVVGTSEAPDDPYEPNDFLSEATPYTLGEEIRAELSPEGDVDTFVFALARAHDLRVSGSYDQMLLLDAGGETLEGLWYPSSNENYFHVPAAGVYYVQVVYGGQYTFRLEPAQRPIYVSFTTAGKLGGVTFAPGDILRYTAIDGGWQSIFRAADFGLRGNLVAFSLGEDGVFYLVYATPQNVPGVGRLTPYDILRYDPGNPDWGTPPEWSLVFDGSQVGLTTAGERIDALTTATEYWTGNSVYYLSTTGQARVPFGVGQLMLANNDLFHYTGALENGVMTGSFDVNTVGTPVGLGRANVIGMDKDEQSLYLTFDRALKLGGVALDRGDIANCHPESWYDPVCSEVDKLFDASAVGLRGYRIDAFEVGPYETP